MTVLFRGYTYRNRKNAVAGRFGALGSLAALAAFFDNLGFFAFASFKAPFLFLMSLQQQVSVSREKSKSIAILQSPFITHIKYSRNSFCFHSIFQDRNACAEKKQRELRTFLPPSLSCPSLYSLQA